MAHYRTDPKWMAAGFGGKCAKCGEQFSKGARIFYYPQTRSAYTLECAAEAARDFEAHRVDEDGY